MVTLDDLPSRSGKDGAFSKFTKMGSVKVPVLLPEKDTTPRGQVVTVNPHFLMHALKSKAKVAPGGTKRKPDHPLPGRAPSHAGKPSPSAAQRLGRQ